MTPAEQLENRLMQLQARIKGLNSADYSIIDRGKIRARLCNECIEVQRQLQALSDPTLVQPSAARKPRSQSDVLIVGTRQMKLLDAIERVLHEADHPLDAEDIAYIIADNHWVKRFRRNPSDVVREMLARHLSSGDQPDIDVVHAGKNSRYWLSRKGAPVTQPCPARQPTFVENG
jgi:hypothetical protein